MRGNKSVDKEKFSSCFDNGFEWIGARPRVEPGVGLSIWKMRHHHWNIWRCKFYFLLTSHTFHFSFSLRPTSISTDIKVAFCPTRWFVLFHKNWIELVVTNLEHFLSRWNHFLILQWPTKHDFYVCLYLCYALDLGYIWNWICSHKNMYLIHLIFIKL